MKITEDAIRAWQELTASFEALSEVMTTKNGAVMQDQLTRAKVLAADTQVLIEKLRRT